MIIREYQPSDCKELAALFYNTVHTINAKDYTNKQLNAWATGQVDLEEWNQSFQGLNSTDVRTLQPSILYNADYKQMSGQEE